MNIKVGDLLQFRESGALATVVEVRKDKGAEFINDYAMLLVSGKVHYKNPTCMTLTMIERTAEVVSYAS